MAQIFETKANDDDETSIKLYFGYNHQQLQDLINHLIKLERGETEDDFIILQSEGTINDGNNRSEVTIKFDRS